MRAPRTTKVPLSSGRRAGTAISRLPEEKLARHRAGHALDLLRLPFGDDVAAVLTCAGAHVDEPVGRPHHLLVVLHDEHGVAEIAQPLERDDQPSVVPLVEPIDGSSRM